MIDKISYGRLLAEVVPLVVKTDSVADVLNGRRAISKQHAKHLAEFFHVPVSLFI